MRAWGLKLAGHTNAQIGEALGCTPQHAWVLIKEAWRSLERDQAEMVVDLEMGRLDAALRVAVDIMVQSHQAGEYELALKAADRLVRIGESRRALVGADLKRTEGAGDVDQAEQDLLAVIKEQKARNAADAAGLLDEV